MSGETIVTVVGNLTADPELRFTGNGIAVANFTIASTPKKFDRQKDEWVDEEALFLRASVWREFAEQVSQSLAKGSRVIAQGRLKQRSFENQSGEKRTVIELEVDEIGPSLKYATAQVTRTQGGSAGRTTAPVQQSFQSQPAADGVGDVWGAPGETYPAAESLPF
jgi:single-strand DNA-binding protein